MTCKSTCTTESPQTQSHYRWRPWLQKQWIFRIQSKREKHKGVLGKQRKPLWWHQKSTVLGPLLLCSQSIRVLSTVPVTGQSLLFIQTWLFREVPNLGSCSLFTNCSASWLIRCPVRYQVPIGTVIWALAAWLPLLWPVLPTHQGPEEACWHWAGQGVSDKGSSEARSLLRAVHTSPALSRARSSCVHQFSTPASLRATFWQPSRRAWCTRLKHMTCVAALPPAWRQMFGHLILHILMISTSRDDTSQTACGITLHHWDKTAEYGSIPSENLEWLAVSLPWQIEHLPHWRSADSDRNSALIQK